MNTRRCFIYKLAGNQKFSPSEIIANNLTDKKLETLCSISCPITPISGDESMKGSGMDGSQEEKDSEEDSLKGKVFL